MYHYLPLRSLFKELVATKNDDEENDIPPLKNLYGNDSTIKFSFAGAGSEKEGNIFGGTGKDAVVSTLDKVVKAYKLNDLQVEDITSDITDGDGRIILVTGRMLFDETWNTFAQTLCLKKKKNHYLHRDLLRIYNPKTAYPAAEEEDDECEAEEDDEDFVEEEAASEPSPAPEAQRHRVILSRESQEEESEEPEGEESATEPAAPEPPAEPVAQKSPTDEDTPPAPPKPSTWAGIAVTGGSEFKGKGPSKRTPTSKEPALPAGEEAGESSVKPAWPKKEKNFANSGAAGVVTSKRTPPTTLFVKNIVAEVTQKELSEVFAGFGNVKSVKITHKPNKEFATAFVTFDSSKAFDKALESTRGSLRFKGTTMLMEAAKQNVKKGSVLGRNVPGGGKGGKGASLSSARDGGAPNRNRGAGKNRGSTGKSGNDGKGAPNPRGSGGRSAASGKQ